MKNNRLNFAMLVTLLALAVFMIAAPMSAEERRSYASAPAATVTEGLTAEEHVQRQAELSRRLLEDLPSAAAESAIRVGLTREEVSAIDRATSKLPLQIGLVKALARGIEVYGLAGGTLERQRSRGKSGEAFPTREGGFVWAAVVTSENAGAIRLHVQDMSLPRNAELYFYSRDGQAYGPYTGSGPHGNGEFWTATIFGREAILQVRVSSGSRADLRNVSFKVAEAGLITPRFALGLRGEGEVKAAANWPCGNPNCVVDASCQSGFSNLKLAVAKMEWVQGAFIYTCTGGLINDNNPTQNNFFITANHCLSKTNTAKNLNLYWRFATSACNATCPSNNGWPYQTSGATVSKTGRRGDFSLLHLNSNPPAGSVILGWTTTPVANTNGTILNRVSNPNFGPQVYSQHRVDTAVGTCSGWPRGERIYSRDVVGAIDGGSSGSPIVNASSQIVGQLSGSCGFNPSDPCASGPGEDNATVDGAFAFYYPLVQPILNP